MQRCNGPSLNAGNEDPVGVVLVVFDEIARRLLGWYGDQRHTLVGRLEPYNFRLFWLSLMLVSSRVPLSLLSFGFLLLLGCLAAGP